MVQYEEKHYRAYIQDLRQKLIEVKKQQERKEKKQILEDNREELAEKRLLKLKKDAEEKLIQIEEFRKTLDQIEWKEEEKKKEKKQKLLKHQEFL